MTAYLVNRQILLGSLRVNGDHFTLLSAIGIKRKFLSFFL